MRKGAACPPEDKENKIRGLSGGERLQRPRIVLMQKYLIMEIPGLDEC